MDQLLQGSKSDLLAISKYASCDRCQGIGQGCNCAYGQARGLSIICGVFPANVFLPYITSQLETVNRLDIVWNRYLTSSLKHSTRNHRRHSGTMQIQRVIAGVPIPANWEAFLRSSANKDELFCYLSECTQACEIGRKVIISTKDETIVSIQNDMNDIECLQPCSHEEADTRILFHVAHCARQRLRKVVIRTVDTDVNSAIDNVSFPYRFY